jgi:hypothetical protein
MQDVFLISNTISRLLLHNIALISLTIDTEKLIIPSKENEQATQDI